MSSPARKADELAELEALVNEMSTVVSDDERYTQLNRSFHMAIYAAAQSPRLEKLIGDLRDASSAYLRMYTSLLPTGEESQRDHEEILQAIRSGDLDEVERTVAAYCECRHHQAGDRRPPPSDRPAAAALSVRLKGLRRIGVEPVPGLATVSNTLREQSKSGGAPRNRLQLMRASGTVDRSRVVHT
jgi:hypothetical protein